MPTAGRHRPDRVEPAIALFWDQSLVWGLICRKTLERLGIAYQAVNAREIARGVLNHFRVLLVPGGWASHKSRTLGSTGKSAVVDFVNRGGSYMGFCGGAGLALDDPASLGLAPIARRPFSERLPNISGRITIRGRGKHPAWQCLPKSLQTSVWWPSQFNCDARPQEWIVATYEAPGHGFWTADLPLEDLTGIESDLAWDEWEQHYGINLDPERIVGEPAIIEVPCGKGRAILSYPHLETPGDAEGNRLFQNLLGYLEERAERQHLHGHPAPLASRLDPIPRPPCAEAFECLKAARDTAEELISFGRRHLLWNWRLPWLLHWRRGLRGLEYGSLTVALRFLCDELEPLRLSSAGGDSWLEPARILAKDVKTFCRQAKALLLEEKVATQSAVLSKIGNVNDTVDRLREKLFGTKMNHDGLCRQMLDRVDRLLYLTVRLRTGKP